MVPPRIPLNLQANSADIAEASGVASRPTTFTATRSRVFLSHTIATGELLISLKKYLDMDSQSLASALEREEPQSATLESYRAVLRTVAKSAAQACPALGAGLEHSLLGLERRLAIDPSPVAVVQTEKHVEIQLKEWGERTAVAPEGEGRRS